MVYDGDRRIRMLVGVIFATQSGHSVRPARKPQLIVAVERETS